MPRPTSPLSSYPRNRPSRQRLFHAVSISVVLTIVAILSGWVVFHGSVVNRRAELFSPAAPSQAPLVREWQALRFRYFLRYEEPIFDVAVFVGGLLLFAMGAWVRQFSRHLAVARQALLARWARQVEAKELFKLENELRTQRIQIITSAAQIFAGVALLVGIYFAWANLLTTRQGQITDRFIRAIDQLGATNKDGKPEREIRLGGIYGLQRIAEESPENYQPIRDILNDYIRLNAPWTWTGDYSARKRSQAAIPAIQYPLHPAIDVQTALNFLAHPTTKHGARFFFPDLPGVDLRGANLGAAELNGANLNGAHLEGAMIGSAKLEFAQLRGTHLEGASLMYAKMDEAYLGFSHLDGADLRGARLNHAYMWSADLDGAFLNGALLQDTNFDSVSLRGAHIGGTDLGEVSDLTQKQVDSAYGNTKTKLPRGIHMPEWWRKSGDSDEWSVGISQ